MTSEASRVVLTAVAIFFFVTTVALAIAFAVVFSSSKDATFNPVPSPQTASVLRDCPTGGDVKPNDPNNPAVWDDLSSIEIERVEAYMVYKSKLGIRTYERAAISQSYIFLIELHLPDKYTVLDFIENDNASKPERMAKVTVFNGDLSPPEVREYLVGPLPHPKHHSRLFAYPKYGNTIPYTDRPIDSKEVAMIKVKVIVPMMSRLREILNESFGATFGEDCGSRCLTFSYIYPTTTVTGVRKNWFWFMYDVETKGLHPVGLQILINHDSRYSNAWFVEQVWYNGVTMQSTSELILRYENGSLPKIKQVRYFQ